jgi:hypothetical protein
MNVKPRANEYIQGVTRAIFDSDTSAGLRCDMFNFTNNRISNNNQQSSATVDHAGQTAYPKPSAARILSSPTVLI